MALTLMPFLIFCGLSVMGCLWWIQQKENIQWACENQTLKAQAALMTATNLLLKLNPPMEAFVLEKKLLKAALRVAPTPVAKAAIIARLVFVRTRITMISAQQQILFQTYESKAQLYLWSLKNSIQHLVHDMEQAWSTSLYTNVRYGKIRLHLQKRRIDHGAYLYLIPPHFTQLQTLPVTIIITGKTLFPRWLQWLTSQPLSWQERCNMEPVYKEAKWSARIRQDKSSWSF